MMPDPILNAPIPRGTAIDDKYGKTPVCAYLTGIEALVKLPMLQRQRDQLAGINTAGFISGYRGSPLGGLDHALWKAADHLKQHHITFQPGVNEDLAATACWGSQQVHLYPQSKYEGIFSLWYGKGPGVDRSMDAIRHANAFGTAPQGGVLAVAGDDHAAKSSTLPHQTEHMFVGVSMPILSPANVQEVLDFGIYGWALSRYCGTWVALKAVTENMDSAMSTVIDPQRVRITLPEDFVLPPTGIHAELGRPAAEQEYSLQKYRIYAARAFARQNQLNPIVIDSPRPRLGIVTGGKAYLDVLQALADLGIDPDLASAIGLRVLKIGMPWPLEPRAVHEFAKGLEEILVVEEKRSVIEDQLTGQLYNWPVADRPIVVGEFDEQGLDLLVNYGELTPAVIAQAIAGRIARFYESERIEKRLRLINAKSRELQQVDNELKRSPHFCSGCPHNTSTKVPEGSRAGGGIGCHYMATWMDRQTESYTHMGGEGAQWLGQAPFTHEQHIFQNLGDGTYFHSGILAIRAAVSGKVNITFKILYNGAVAMTGGQPVDGPLDVPMLVAQVKAEGVQKIAIVSEDLTRYRGVFATDPHLSIHHRSRLDAVQRELRQISGTTVLIYDQACAAERRRAIKSGSVAASNRRIFINEAVCEGCGDCSIQSNCLSVVPKETALGRKRRIDQSACNQDFSCVEGFCPSFVSVIGGNLRRPPARAIASSTIVPPEPPLPDLQNPWNTIITGIGGSGVLTVGSVLAMAAHLAGRGVTNLNQTGLAQKFGAVISHVRIGRQQEDIYASRIASGDADLLLGCDLMVARSSDALDKLNPERSHAVVNSHPTTTADFIKNPDLQLPVDYIQQQLSRETQEQGCHWIDATGFAQAVLGDTLASNFFLLGYAYQEGLVPVHANHLNEAIALNGASVTKNQEAFLLGRQAAHDFNAFNQGLGEETQPQAVSSEAALEQAIETRYHDLIAYQDKDYAEAYLAVIARTRSAEGSLPDCDPQLPLTEAVTRHLYRVMAYKDEYEVARLFSDGRFKAQLAQQFSGPYSLKFHMAPPLIASKDPATGRPRKLSLPHWTLYLFSVLAKLKVLRGSRLDVFGYAAERREERAYAKAYQADLAHILDNLCQNNYEIAVSIAQLPAEVRGFGHIKHANKARTEIQRATLLKRFDRATAEIFSTAKATHPGNKAT